MSNVESRPIESTEYRILEVEVSGERFFEPINLRNMINEINIYEHIDKPFLTATMVFTDNESLYTRIGFLGTERIKIKIAVDNIADPDFSIEKHFVVSEVQASAKINDTNEVFVLHMIEVSGYISKLTRVSKSFDGTPVDIIKKIMNTYLSTATGTGDPLELKILGKNNEADHKMRVIVPNMTPMKAMNWIKKSASTIDGMPYFLFSCVADDKLRFVDLETILSSKPLNIGNPYIYSQAGARSDITNLIENSYIISNLSSAGKENQIELAVKGLVSSTYNFLDHTTGSFESQKFNVNDMFQKLKDKGSIFKKQQNQEVLDNTTLIGNTGNSTMLEYDTKSITQIATTGLYNNGISNYHDAPDISSHMNKARSLSMRHFLHKSSINITVPGRNFISDEKNVSIGNIIDVKVLLNLGDILKRDNKRSGEHMIYAVRHHFSGKAYHAIVSCTKLTNEEEPT